MRKQIRTITFLIVKIYSIRISFSLKRNWHNGDACQSSQHNDKNGKEASEERLLRGFLRLVRWITQRVLHPVWMPFNYRQQSSCIKNTYRIIQKQLWHCLKSKFRVQRFSTECLQPDNFKKYFILHHYEHTSHVHLNSWNCIMRLIWL